VYFQGVKTAGA